MYFSKNPKSLMTNDLHDLRDQGCGYLPLPSFQGGEKICCFFCSSPFFN